MTPPVVVKISVKSAIELKLLVQNAMCEDESESAKSMREEVFNAVPEDQDAGTVRGFRRIVTKQEQPHAVRNRI